MELRQLAYFTTIAQVGGFRRAADVLDVSQTTLSVQIKLLEGELRTSLLVRGSRGTTLTDAGQLFLVRANRIMSEVALGREEMLRFADVERGQVKIGMISPDSMRWVPHLLAEFKRHHPRVSMTLVERPSEHLLALLRDGELDVAWLVLAADGVNAPTGVLLERLANDDFVLVLPREHPLAGRGSVSVQQLVAEPLIVPPAGEHGRSVIDEAFRAQGTSPIVAFESSDRSIRLALAAEGLGIALSSALGAARGDSSLPTLTLHGAATRHSLVLAWGEQAVRAKAAAAFVAFARAHAHLAATGNNGRAALKLPPIARGNQGDSELMGWRDAIRLLD